MANVCCKRCGYITEKINLCWCPDHGEFHQDGGPGYCGKYRTRCDGLYRVCCPECGFIPCEVCHGYGVLKDENNKKCYHCHGTGKEPFRPREPAREHPTFKEQMLLEAKEFALRSGIRYLLIMIGRGEYITLKDVRYPGYSYSIPLYQKERRNFYGWLRCFARGKNRRLANKWQDLLKPIST